MKLETERIIIRDFAEKDVNDLYEIFSDDETMEHIESVYNLQQTEKFLKEFCIERNGAVAAVCKENNKVIGYVLFKELEDDVYEIGWIFNKNYWRKGYAYEACSGLIKYAFEKMKIHKIVAETTDGEKSVNLMKKLGMKREGIQRSHTRDGKGNWVDFYLYGLLEKDFKSNISI